MLCVRVNVICIQVNVLCVCSMCTCECSVCTCECSMCAGDTKPAPENAKHVAAKGKASSRKCETFKGKTKSSHSHSKFFKVSMFYLEMPIFKVFFFFQISLVDFVYMNISSYLIASCHGKCGP